MQKHNHYSMPMQRMFSRSCIASDHVRLSSLHRIMSNKAIRLGRFDLDGARVAARKEEVRLGTNSLSLQLLRHLLVQLVARSLRAVLVGQTVEAIGRRAPDAVELPCK